MKIFRYDRCAVCFKLQGHPVHRVRPPASILHRLLHLAWPRWMWGEGEGRHKFVYPMHVRLAESAAALRRQLKKGKRNVKR